MSRRVALLAGLYRDAVVAKWAGVSVERVKRVRESMSVEAHDDDQCIHCHRPRRDGQTCGRRSCRR